jgi:hypothetical protein
MQSGLKSGQAVILQHVKQSGLSGIVETEEEDLGILVQQAYQVVFIKTAEGSLIL